MQQELLQSYADQVARWRDSAGEVERIRVNVTPHEDLDESFQFDYLGARGVRLAIDDFGTGYSSLFHLQKLEADTL